MKDLSVEVIEKPVEPVEEIEEAGKFPTNEDKREAVKKWFESYPTLHHLSNREIAKIRFCGHSKRDKSGSRFRFQVITRG